MTKEAPTASDLSPAKLTQLSWRMAAKVIPHPEKVALISQDTCFVLCPGTGWSVVIQVNLAVTIASCNYAIFQYSNLDETQVPEGAKGNWFPENSSICSPDASLVSL